ncbi:MAG: aminotransferase class V-fold PLP-dependent enzyme [Alphaproteobacteria bacterium]|jgi:isopenicillin-N epimerase|nr:aminotransferase class V-fold PLP-dependent enzyme [Alphaproteobacteria bacterium]
MRPLWPLEAGAVYLNHGTVGVTLRAVLAAQAEIRDEIERQPARFMLREVKDRLRAAAERVAGVLGGQGRDYVFTDNATTGINAVLRSTPLRPGDEVLVTDHTYGAVRNAAAYACRQAGATLRTAEIPFPLADEESAIAPIREALSVNTRLAILDHITSETAIVLPLRRLVELCHQAGARVLVDGAHAPGTIDLDIPGLGADWYAANLHKWLFAPRGCGVLWAAEDVQSDLHPAVVSWRLDEGFTAEFDWTGTRDPSPFLSFPAAADFMAELGWPAVRDHNHQLANDAARMLAERFGGTVGAPTAMTGVMALAPLPERFPANRELAQALREELLYKQQIEVHLAPWAGRIWARLAAQVYCEMADFERLAVAIEDLAGDDALVN